MFCIESTDGSIRTAVEYAQSALRAYGNYHPELVHFAHDVALFLGTHSDPLRVLPLLRAIADQLTGANKMLATSTVARIAGAANRRLDFLSAWQSTWQLLDCAPSYHRGAAALVHLARGAEMLGDPERVTVAAMEALRIAQQREEHQEVEEAKEMLGLRPRVAGPFPHPHPVSREVHEAAVALTDELLDAIVQIPALRGSLLPHP
ncbi:MAG TPA: hypothetical protein VFQ45_15705 [Longimicrobium sp.]|nr:hypothetical protein [Longimicrobium sp.]